MLSHSGPLQAHSVPRCKAKFCALWYYHNFHWNYLYVKMQDKFYKIEFYSECGYFNSCNYSRTSDRSSVIAISRIDWILQKLLVLDKVLRRPRFTWTLLDFAVHPRVLANSSPVHPRVLVYTLAWKKRFIAGLRHNNAI